MPHWFQDAFLYHVYPLGALGAPARNDGSTEPARRIEGLYAWLESAAELGADAMYVGPIFESSTHGYDTADYNRVDRRLGDAAAFAAWSEALHRRGLKLMLDAVFNHVGRDFWAFRELLADPERSRYRDWFLLEHGKHSPYGDPFSYQCWNGHFNLVKLNVAHPEVRAHLFDAVRGWVEQFGVDGLRLDAADVLDLGFQSELARHCRSLRSDFALLGEVIHGDYRRWVSAERLDSVTNYELHKGLYSSHNDRNYFELAHTLSRQFARGGRYEGSPLCVFADNHDVDRIASRLRAPAEIYPLHILLFSVPGVPAIYYGSEWGLPGRKGKDDRGVRPALTPTAAAERGEHRDLRKVVMTLARLRRALPALRGGSYRELSIAPRQFAFERFCERERVVVAVNAAEEPIELRLTLSDAASGRLVDMLNEQQTFSVAGGAVQLPLSPRWGRILRWEP
jgi:glycosidase